jgi:uncharacterized membrane protein YeaQ/YmgE (transglycosylase-associated protein family)
MDWIGTIIGALFAGIIIGPLARLVMPGKQDIGLFTTILAGAAGALVGGLIAQFLGVGETAGIDWIKHAIQVACAAGAVGGFLALKKS